MASLYLSKLQPEDRVSLLKSLHASQMGMCFICEEPIDLVLHSDGIDIDHVEPQQVGGKDGPENFAITHAHCNRSKQAADLRVARVLARFGRIQAACEAENRAPNLADVLVQYGGAQHELKFDASDGSVRLVFDSIGDPGIHTSPLLTDRLSRLSYFFAELPIAYLHHDDRINPRAIGGSLAGLVNEFHRGRPQLHVALAWVDRTKGSAQVKVFDGQHKATAQVLLGVRALPVRVFVDPDPDLLLTTNTNAGTTLRQVAFDKSVQRRLGQSLFTDRLERFRHEKRLESDDESMSERDLVNFFRGESREVKRYALDAVRAAITHHMDNKLTTYVEFGGKSTEKPLSYSTIEKTFLSFFIFPDVLDTPLNYRAEVGLNPRTLEIDQVVRLMNLVADTLLVDQFDTGLGTARLENKVQKGDLVPEPHLRAFRMCKEEVIYSWLRYVRQIVQLHFTFAGQPFDDTRSFQYLFPEQLWVGLRAYLVNLRSLPLWVNRDLSATVFGGRQTNDYWRSIFETGRSSQDQQVLAAPLNLMDMIKEPSVGTP
ncbi:MAG TPA: HNH endonuclease signature motif containing protein [Candidatus Acidoferrales bacterium]|nr:HNH endonuclease signature motif containing protein [Candidatus Acidoferrales bacterium]HVC23605.1 HNH endonuclease signature motif containing protein [Candidatus Dormibacteraeota bacterium]